MRPATSDGSQAGRNETPQIGRKHLRLKNHGILSQGNEFERYHVSAHGGHVGEMSCALFQILPSTFLSSSNFHLQLWFEPLRLRQNLHSLFILQAS